MALSSLEKNNIAKLKDMLITNVKDVLKYKLTADEDLIINEVLEFSLKDQVGRYQERYKHLVRDNFMVLGIVSVHKQLEQQWIDELAF